MRFRVTEIIASNMLIMASFTSIQFFPKNNAAYIQHKSKTMPMAITANGTIVNALCSSNLFSTKMATLLLRV